MTISVATRFTSLISMCFFFVVECPAQNALTPPDSALIACYPFSGNAADSSGNGNHGMVNGATLVTDRLGNPYSAYYFNGANQNIIIPGFSNKMSTSEFSISFWAIPTVYATRSAFLMTPDDIYNRLNIHLYYYSQTFWDFGDIYANGRLLISSGSVPPASGWDHWVFVVSVQSNLMACYRNGQLYGSKTGAAPFSNAQQRDLLIGGGFGNGSSHFWFHGGLDDIKIYRRKLSAADAINLYNNAATCKNSGSATPVTSGGRFNETTNATIIPNPNKGAFIQVVGAFADNTQMDIFNVTGGLIHHVLILSQETAIDLKNVVPGMYYVKLTGRDGKIITQKMIVY